MSVMTFATSLEHPETHMWGVGVGGGVGWGGKLCVGEKVRVEQFSSQQLRWNCCHSAPGSVLRRDLC